MKKKTIITVSVMACLVLSICVVKGESKRISFFKESEIVNIQVSQETKVNDLSNKMGILLDSGVEKHKALIDRYDDIIVYENAFVGGEFILQEKDNFKNTLSTNAIGIYTGSEETSEFYLNFALIHGLHEKGTYESVFQIKWKKSPLLINQKTLRVSTTNMHWDTNNKNSHALLVYYEGANSWVTKKEEAPNVFWVDYYPDFITPIQGGKKTALNTLIQAWGTCFYSTKNVTDDLWATINFSFLKNKFGWGAYEYNASCQSGNVIR